MLKNPAATTAVIVAMAVLVGGSLYWIGKTNEERPIPRPVHSVDHIPSPNLYPLGPLEEEPVNVSPPVHNLTNPPHRPDTGVPTRSRERQEVVVPIPLTRDSGSTLHDKPVLNRLREFFQRLDNRIETLTGS